MLAAAVAALALAALVAAAGLSSTCRVRGVVALVLISLVWLVVNKPMEGALILKVSRGHGLTGADLAGFVGLALAAYRGALIRRARSRRPG